MFVAANFVFPETHRAARVCKFCGTARFEFVCRASFFKLPFYTNSQITETDTSKVLAAAGFRAGHEHNWGFCHEKVSGPLDTMYRCNLSTNSDIFNISRTGEFSILTEAIALHTDNETLERWIDATFQKKQERRWLNDVIYSEFVYGSFTPEQFLAWWEEQRVAGTIPAEVFGVSE